jgi:hypothetical protein
MQNATDTQFNLPNSISIPPVPSSTASLTIAGVSSASALQTFVPSPSGLPEGLLFPNASTPSGDDTIISVLFDQALNWEFANSKTGNGSAIGADVLFRYFPVTIANALNIDQSLILTQNVTEFKPAEYKNPLTDADKLLTLFVAYIPTANVTNLANDITTPRSIFYTASTGIPYSLAQHVDPSHPITSYVNPEAGNPAAASGGSGLSKMNQNIVIGVVTALGGLALIIVAFLAWRAYKRRRDAKAALIAAGGRPSQRSFDRDSQGSPRRRSFYFAEDSLQVPQPPEPGSTGSPTEHPTSLRTMSPVTDPSSTARDTAAGEGMSQIAPSGISSGIKSGLDSGFSRFTEADSTQGLLGGQGR